jgi:hypothetical protein
VTRARLRQAFAAYAVLAGIGAATLEGDIRLVLLIFLAGLALKSYIACLRNEMDSADTQERGNDRDAHPRP